MGSSGGDASAPIRDLFLDFIAKGSVQLVRKSYFLSSSSPLVPAQDGGVEGNGAPESSRMAGRGKGNGAKSARQTHEAPLDKRLALIEFSEGDCYTALDIYGGRDRWTCSAVATSEVEVMRINFRDFRNLIAPQVAFAFCIKKAEQFICLIFSAVAHDMSCCHGCEMG